MVIPRKLLCIAIGFISVSSTNAIAADHEAGHAQELIAHQQTQGSNLMSTTVEVVGSAAVAKEGTQTLTPAKPVGFRTPVRRTSHSRYRANVRRTNTRSSGGAPQLPGGRRYYQGRYFGNFNNRFYGPQYGYF